MPVALPAPESSTCAKVRGLARRLTGLYDVALSAHGLTVTQYAALATLARASDALPVAELARRLQMERTTTTRLVAPLLAGGLLARLDGRKILGDGRARPFVRLGYARCTPREIREGVSRMRAALTLDEHKPPR